MKAKMPTTQKPPETGEYECFWCDTVFLYVPEDDCEFFCPRCHTASRLDLVPIYMENSNSEQKMYTAADWHGG